MSGNLAYRGENVSSVYIEEKSSYVIEELVDILHTLECSEMSDKDKMAKIHECSVNICKNMRLNRQRGEEWAQ